MRTTFRRARILPLLTVAVTTTTALGSTSEVWDGSNNAWSTAAHWAPAAVPNNGTPAGSTYTVTINAGIVNLDISPTIDSLSVTSGTLNGNLGNTFTVLGATTNTSGTIQFGTSTAAGAHATFGTVNNSGSFTTGYFAGGNDTLITGAFTNQLNANFYVAGAGDVANLSSFVNLGHFQVFANATVSLTGGGNGFTDVPQGSILQAFGDFNVINSNVSTSALGHLATIEGDLQLANHNITSVSALSISGTGGIELVGNEKFSAPSVNNSGAVNLGYFATGNNTLTIAGTLTNNANAFVRLQQSGDVVNVGALTNAGSVSISAGETLNITGGGSGLTDVVQGSLFSLSGNFNVMNGNVSTSGLGHLASVEGDLRLGASSSLSTVSALTISNTGQLELVGNQAFSVPSINNSGSVNLGYFATGNNTLNVTGTLAINANAVLRIAGTGDIVNVGSISNAGTISISPTETLNITGGGNGITDVAQGSTYSIGGAFNVTNGNATASAFGHLATIEGDLRLGTGSPITDASNITISSTGGIELTGNQTFTVPNINNSGSVNLGYFATGNNTLNVTGTLTLNANAVLRIAGTGDIVNVGSISNAGTLSIASTEVLNITGGGLGITNIAAGSSILLSGSINVINNNVPSNGLAKLDSISGNLQLLNGQSLSVGNLTVNSTGQLALGSASTLIATNINNSGFVASSFFTSTGNTLTVTGTFTNNAGATLDIQPGDTTNLPTLNNSGTVNVGLTYTMPILNGGTGAVNLSNNTILTLNGGSSHNTIRDSNQFNVFGSLISNGNVQTGPLQLANVTINGHHTLALPGNRILNLTLQGTSGNWTSGLNLAPFAKTIIEDSATHNATLARTLDQVAYGRTHANGIYSSTLAANERMVVIDNASLPFGSFGGQAADAGSILLMPTYLGDANLDSAVDLTDLSIVLNNFGSTTSSWLNGNFDGAATIDLTDLSAVLNNFGSNGGVGPNIVAAPQAVSTPEPASLALLAFGLAAALKRRR